MDQNDCVAIFDLVCDLTNKIEQAYESLAATCEEPSDDMPGVYDRDTGTWEFEHESHEHVMVAYDQRASVLKLLVEKLDEAIVLAEQLADIKDPV